MVIDFVGPLPPPVHGFAWVNQQMLDRLRICAEVRVRDRAWPRASSGALRKFLGVAGGLWHCLGFMLKLVTDRPATLYLGCSGGLGMLVDAPFVLLARLFGVPVYVHHHAYSYLNAPDFMARFCLGQMRGCQHIVLCQHMGQLLSLVHGIPAGQIAVLSNVAFLSVYEKSSCASRDRLVVGFLSNITREKGIFDFFDLAARFSGRSDSPDFLIAGPVAPGIAEEFNARLTTLPNVRHLGPLYGESKDDFYRSLDVLAFPTRYANEAEPVTILEALRAGVPVVANLRGGISSMIDEASGLGVADAASFVPEAEQWISRLMSSQTCLAEFRQGARSRFASLRAAHVANLARYLDRIAKGLPLGDRA